jgi:hypothetical protein
MDMHGVPKWALYGGIVVVVFLVLKARSGGGTSSGTAAVAADKSQAKSVAEQLQEAALKENFNRQKALSDLDLRVRAEQAQYSSDLLGWAHRLATDTRTDADAAFQCPVGKARINPATGEIYCRKNAGGGLTLGSVLGNAARAYQQSQAPYPGGTG